MSDYSSDILEMEGRIALPLCPGAADQGEAGFCSAPWRCTVCGVHKGHTPPTGHSTCPKLHSAHPGIAFLFFKTLSCLLLNCTHLSLSKWQPQMTASAAPGNVLETQICRPHPDPLSQRLRDGPHGVFEHNLLVILTHASV